jgi:hypothetical protein
MGIARPTSEDEPRNNRLTSHARYFVNPIMGQPTTFTVLQTMNLELLDTGHSVAANVIDKYRPGSLQDC